MDSRLNYSGLVVAGVGFFLTRFTVALAVDQSPARFYLSGVVPLVLGLGLSAFGVALTVANVDRELVRTTAAWCVVGTAGMLALVVLTLLGATPEGETGFAALQSRTYLSNFLIGGSVGGTLTGLYASRNRRQRTRLRRQATRLEVLNQLLRHEVLNGLTAIRGYAALREAGGRNAEEVVADRSDDIEETIEEVGYLTESAEPGDTALGPVGVRGHVEESVDSVRERYPDATSGPPSLSIEFPGSIHRFDVRYGGGTLTAYVDGSSRGVFRDVHTLRVSDLSVSESANATSDGLSLRVNQTFQTGPLEVTTLNEDGEAVAADLTVANRSVQATGDDGTLWTVAPDGTYTVTATRDGDSVSVTVG